MDFIEIFYFKMYRLNVLKSVAIHFNVRVLDMDIHVYCSFIKISFLGTSPLTQFTMNE